MLFFSFFIVHVMSEDHFIFSHLCERDILSLPLLLCCPTTSLVLSWAFSWLRVLHLQGLAGVATWMLRHLIKSIICLSQIEFTTSSPELTFCSSFCVISIILLAILKGTKKDLWYHLQIFCIRLWMLLISHFPHPNDLCTYYFLFSCLLSFIVYSLKIIVEHLVCAIAVSLIKCLPSHSYTLVMIL